jgi:curved DNA-binding protein CbpA
MNTDSRNNYYDILEVNQSATQHEIVLAFERAKRTYSQQNPALYSVFTPDEAESLRNLIEEAYQVLSNQTYRNIYEKRLLSRSFSESDLSLEAIKAASSTLYTDSVVKVTPISPISGSSDSSSATESKRDLELENKISTTTEWTGSFLKDVREYKKISVEQLHDQTKINPWYITAIEKVEPQNLPAAVFVRGYVLQIAKSLQLNEKTVADSYMKTFKIVSEQKK